MSKNNNDNQWPLPQFYFKVTLGSLETSFQEVYGLDAESETIEYQHGDSIQFFTFKMPEIKKTGSITLKKGVFVKDNNFFEWYAAFKKNTIKRETVIIQLIDQDGNPTMTWSLTNAWPTKITGTDLKSDSNEATIETLELAHEEITIVNGE